MTVHRVNNRTLYFDDAAPKGVWPFTGCFGPWFPKTVKVDGEWLTLVDGLRYPEIRAVYKTPDSSMVIFVKRNCKYLIERNTDSSKVSGSAKRSTQRRSSRR